MVTNSTQHDRIPRRGTELLNIGNAGLDSNFVAHLRQRALRRGEEDEPGGCCQAREVGSVASGVAQS